VRTVGATGPNEAMARNQIRAKPGQPLSAEMVRGDIQRLTRLGRFRQIDATVQPYADGSVSLTYQFVEARLIRDVQAVGNRQVSDQDLAREVGLLANTPIDEFEIGRAANRIRELYRRKGYYLAEVSVDREELDRTGNVIFRIRERERVKVTDIRVRGNQHLDEGRILDVVRTKTAGLFETGPLDDETLDQDVAAIIRLYRDNGYLDVRADREVRPSPDAREAIVTFLVDEGPRYTLRSIRAELRGEGGRPSGRPPTQFSTEQLAGLMLIKTGDAYSVDLLEKSMRAVNDAYGRLGYLEARVDRRELRDPDSPQVDLLLLITEGEPSRVGLVIIKNNDLTRQDVIRRRIRLRPERPADATLLRESKEALDNTRLFEGAAGPGGATSVRLTFQPPVPGSPERDLLVEVKETNTGRLGFGVGVSSDSGVIGSIELVQRNFDLFDVPESWDELFSARAFRGAGQTFNITVAPGTQQQTYSIGLADPALFNTDYTGSVGAYFFTRDYNQYDEDRVGGSVAFGRRFGDRWNASLSLRAANVDLHDIEADAPVDVFAVENPHTVTGLGLRLSRVTFDRPVRPTRGAKTDLFVEQVGALGGDYDFTKLATEHAFYIPLHENSLGRFTVLSAKVSAAYIPQDVADTPLYERFYLGGRSFRGFRFRTISPKGIRNDTGTQGDDPVGGTWSFFAGLELEQPIWQDIISGVVFVDSGTVTNEPGFAQYRVSTGLGVRILVPQLSQVPLAFDFGFPVLKQDLDDERLFSFSLDLPF
jgi:outer membrane protein insertion porin family